MAGAGAHVAVGQLEPGAGKDLGERLEIVLEAQGNLAIDRVDLERHVGVGHDRHAADRGVLDVDRHILFGDGDGHPLGSARRALAQRPFVAEQHVEKPVVPLGGAGRPGAFEPGNHRVAANAPAFGLHPAKALEFGAGGFGLGAQISGAAIAVGLADGVPPAVSTVSSSSMPMRANVSRIWAALAMVRPAIDAGG